VVPNDCIMGGEVTQELLNKYGVDCADLANHGGLVYLLLGPNASGKTVYIKMVGIITFLAHIGSFVPAKRAVIGYCDKILTRLQSLESASVEGSSFGIDVTQLSFALHHCTNRSLLLLDEFGKGTSSIDGIALLAGVLSHLCSIASTLDQELSATSLKVLATSHYHEILKQKLLGEPLPSFLRVYAMRVHCDEQRSDCVFLFDLKPWTEEASTSLGLLCAEREGISSAAIIRAREIKESFLCGRPIKRLGQEQQPELVQQQKRRAQVYNNLVKTFRDTDFTKLPDMSSVKQVIREAAMAACPSVAADSEMPDDDLQSPRTSSHKKRSDESHDHPMSSDEKASSLLHPAGNPTPIGTRPVSVDHNHTGSGDDDAMEAQPQPQSSYQQRRTMGPPPVAQQQQQQQPEPQHGVRRQDHVPGSQQHYARHSSPDTNDKQRRGPHHLMRSASRSFPSRRDQDEMADDFDILSIE